jgi:2-hydroxy-3-keto-5-methylthiopentenyl-1-phosphate phosphatase
VLERFGDAAIYERVEAELDAGTMTLNEVIAAEFLTVTTPLEEVVPWLLARTRVRDGFAELARERRPLVISSGFHELIEPVLEQEGVLGDVELRANRLDPRLDGWRVLFRVNQMCSHCGEACKRADLPTDAEVVYAGDGYSDFCAVSAADRVFATGSLARQLAEQGVPFTPLTDFRALASAL